MTSQPVFVGSDVSKARLHLRLWPSREWLSFSNDDEGIQAWVRHVAGLKSEAVGLEACGGYGSAALAALAAFDGESGTTRGQRRTAGGRKPLHDAAYMAALVTGQH